MLRKIIKNLFKFLNKILYRVEYINPEKFPTKGPAIIVANHQNSFDVSVIHCKVKPWVYWVAKKELTDNRFIGKIVSKMGVMPVDRDKMDMSVARSMYKNIIEENIIGIFPQATRVRNKEMINSVIPKTGAVHFALKTGVKIIPVGINGNYKLFSKIKVTVGDPIDMDILKEIYNEEENSLLLKTGYVMNKIYELAGYEYNMNLSPGKVYKNEI